jgi:hypothetical protein
MRDVCYICITSEVNWLIFLSGGDASIAVNTGFVNYDQANPNPI